MACAASCACAPSPRTPPPSPPIRPLTDETGARRFAITLKGGDIAAIEGVADRDAAQRLTGTRLYVDRDRLPPPEDDEFYLTDLIGLAAVTEGGEALGTIRAVEDHGAGAFIIVEGAGREHLLPFTRAVVPVVDVAGGRVTVVPPDEIIVRAAAWGRRTRHELARLHPDAVPGDVPRAARPVARRSRAARRHLVARRP